jgi:hypothetical protein
MRAARPAFPYLPRINVKTDRTIVVKPAIASPTSKKAVSGGISTEFPATINQAITAGSAKAAMPID